MGSSGVVELDLSISVADFERDAKIVLQHIRPSWDLDSVRFKVFTDGITNKLLGCYQPGEFSNMILVRVNGEGTDIIIDRDEEQEAFHVLSAAGCAPPLYCVFKNGIAYGFFPGEPLDEQSVRIPKVQQIIAEEMVRLHSVQGSYAEKYDSNPQSQYGERVRTWINACPTHFDEPAKQAVFEREIPCKDDLRKELNEILENLEALQMNVVFSHNDLLLKNIIYNKKEGTIKFIDYEYAFYNYEAFDIGNHFAEYAGMGEVNYDLYPSQEEQLPWLRHYLEYKAKRDGRSEKDVQDRDVERLYVETNKCACAAHFFWGLWALIQAEHSSIDFDYVKYSSVRFGEYFRRKNEFFSPSATILNQN